ncbi:MAG: TolC family protein [Alistipes sp.]|nr:TolC family protein [Alistipes sp.]
MSAQISLDDYRIAVADYSYELGNARYATIGAEADHRRAKKNYLPSLQSSRDMVLNFRKTDGGRRVDWVMRPEITQPVIDGGALRAETKQAEEALKVARADDESEKGITIPIFPDARMIIISLKNFLVNRHEKNASNSPICTI